MINIATSKVNYFDSLLIMDLVYQVNLKVASEPKIWCVGIKQAINQNNASCKEIIHTIKDMATDNYNAVADVLGIKLTNKILLI